MTFQTGVQSRVVQSRVVKAEVQRGDLRRVLFLLCISQHRLFTLTDRLHSETEMRVLCRLHSRVRTKTDTTKQDVQLSNK